MTIKQEFLDVTETEASGSNKVVYISISSSSSDSGSCSDDEDFDSETQSSKRRRLLDDVLPLGFLDPLTPQERMAMQASEVNEKFDDEIDNSSVEVVDSTMKNDDNGVSRRELAVVKEEEAVVAASAVIRGSKQFWKAGDYQAIVDDSSTSYSVGMEHVRVHPKFLHSNATSHKWALGAFAELLDNALDEACNGASYVRVDVLDNKKDKDKKAKMLLVEDNGGGMSPDKMRQCMSLGYSEKSKSANTIGQYGNGFKTSTMRLGADVIVFSRCLGKDGTSTTQSIGLLSYTFLTCTGKQDIIVPMIDYEKWEDTWTMMPRSSSDDWKRNLDIIVQWSPYENEEDLLRQFDFLESQGTRIIIYNLWEDDEGTQELDFLSDPTDIQIKGVNRDKKKIEMAKTYHNSRHFLTYRHSLRSYASILYLRLPTNFRIILRKEDVVHHSIVNDMMHHEEITYRPVVNPDEAPKCSNMLANVTVGFVKDAKYHIDIQGFNVYHKNRLIKPFWRVWNAAGSSGRGVIGVLEANFVEPAHDKQGFERTAVLSRLENRLVVMQKNFWRKNSHLIGYAKQRVAGEKEATPGARDTYPAQPSSNGARDTYPAQPSSNGARDPYSAQPSSNGDVFNTTPSIAKPIRKQEPVFFNDGESDNEMGTRNTATTSRLQSTPSLVFADSSRKSTATTSRLQSTPSPAFADSSRKSTATTSRLQSIPSPVFVDSSRKSTSYQPIAPKTANNNSNGYSSGTLLAKLQQENLQLRECSQAMLRELQFEKDRNKSLESQLEETNKRLKDLDKDQEIIVETLLEERGRRDFEEENMRKKLNEASDTIQQLLNKVKQFENRAPAPVGSCKIER